MTCAAGLLAAMGMLLLATRAPGPGDAWDDPAAGLLQAPVRPRIPRLASPAAQLAHATGLKAGLRGRPDRERASARELAIEGFRAVRAYWPEDRHACAEASFRAGELLRASRRYPEALAEFEAAHRLGTGTRWAARAWLEEAHVHRRAGRNGRALDAYLGLAAHPSAAASLRDDAGLWAGRVYAREERFEDARRLWRGLAQRAQDPIDRIAAFDELALLLVEEGDLEGAAGMLESCRSALEDWILEETEQGKRVRKGMQRMRTIDRLEQAIAARRDGVIIDGGR